MLQLAAVNSPGSFEHCTTDWHTKSICQETPHVCLYSLHSGQQVAMFAEYSTLTAMNRNDRLDSCLIWGLKTHSSCWGKFLWDNDLQRFLSYKIRSQVTQENPTPVHVVRKKLLTWSYFSAAGQPKHMYGHTYVNKENETMWITPNLRSDCSRILQITFFFFFANQA